MTARSKIRPAHACADTFAVATAEILYGKYADADLITDLEAEHQREIRGKAGNRQIRHLGPESGDPSTAASMGVIVKMNTKCQDQNC